MHFRHFFPFYFLSVFVITSCNSNNNAPTTAEIEQLHLKTGAVISCGSPDKEFGEVNFEMSCNEKVKQDFNTAMELLHSFEYDEAEKVFAKIISESPDCAMAYWGVAMCNFHPLWEPPNEAALVKGSQAVAIANAITSKSEREAAYIHAVAAYYNDWQTTLPLARAVAFEKAMEQLHTKYPDDNEASILYALALDAAASPTDKSYANQKKAGDILNALYKEEPVHPGIIHYIIHTYDYPGLASLALPEARRYATVAPSSAHALHMPSHIFTRLGLWDESIASNTQSVAAAKCYAESAGIKGHWDEELHGLDYLVYAYLQKAENDSAKAEEKYLETFTNVSPQNFKVAYAFAAIPCRIALENKNWKEAVSVQLQQNFPWKNFPWQEAIIHFTHVLGNVHLQNMQAANNELATMKVLRHSLLVQKDNYKANQVAIQIKSSEAWIAFGKGNKTKALQMMKTAADMEDSTSKAPVTPCEVLPARELYADMLFEVKNYNDALREYENVLTKSPKRFNSLFGAGESAEKINNIEKASLYFKQLDSIIDSNSMRTELNIAKVFLEKHP